MSKKLCELCHERPATVPDRNRFPGRLINRVCSKCHVMRLQDDLHQILKKYGQGGAGDPV